MAAWNLHERFIAAYCDNGRIVLSSGHQLVAYHFSSWSFKKPELLSPWYNRYNFSNRPDLVKLYNDYRLSLLENKIQFFDEIACALPCFKKEPVRQSLVKKTLMPGVNLMRRVWQKM
jgi:hypothetical protein